MSLALIQTITGDENAVCSITYDLTNVTAKDSGEIVLKGDSYSAALEAAAGFNELAVSVTMGGKDITHAVWENGTIQIPNVTNPVVITAVAEISDTPNHFRWEMGAQDLVSTGEENTLTRKAGTVASGVINNAYYELQTPVILCHNKPWTVEWSASGNWSGMLFSAKASSAATGNQYLFKTSTSSGLIGFGEPVGSTYENYGIALATQGVDTAASHVYRVENHVAADGSNQAYLFVDDVAYGPMNHFFVGGNNDQGKTVDWLNGRDFVFSYIGTSGHAMNNCKLEYLSVWECTHQFTNYDRYDPEACAEVAVCDHGCGVSDSRPLHSEPEWTWDPEGVNGEDYGSGRVLLALFDEHHQMLEAAFCSSTVYTMVGETVIFRYEPPEFSREVLEKATYIVRFSLDLAERFAPLMRALTFD